MQKELQEPREIEPKMENIVKQNISQQTISDLHTIHELDETPSENSLTNSSIDLPKNK